MRIFCHLLLVGLAVASNSTVETTTGGANATAEGAQAVQQTTTGSGNGTAGSNQASQTETTTGSGTQGQQETTTTGSPTNSNSGTTETTTTAGGAGNGTATVSTDTKASKDYDATAKLTYAGVSSTITSSCVGSGLFVNTALIAAECATKQALDDTSGTTCDLSSIRCSTAGTLTGTGAYCFTPKKPDQTGFNACLTTFDATNGVFTFSGRRARELADARRLSSDPTITTKLTITGSTASGDSFSDKKKKLDDLTVENMAAKVNANQKEIQTALATGGFAGITLDQLKGGTAATVITTFTSLLNVTSTVSDKSANEASTGSSATSSAATVFLSGLAILGASVIF